MAWKVSYIPSFNIIYVKTKGDISQDEFSHQIREVETLAQKFGTNHFLFDDTELNIKLSTLEIIDISNWIKDVRDVKGSRIAVLISLEYKRVENFMFFETVSRNRGLNVKIFFSKSEALEWLKS